MLERNYLNYRLALAELVIKIFGPPCVLAELALRAAPVSAGWILRLGLIYPITTAGYWAVRNAYTDWRNAREAAKRGAVLPPRISGKWPGSLDLALELEKEVSTGYAAYEFRRFFAETGSNTVALRLLWQDIILTQDEVHARHVVTNGFHHWIKGDTTRYIMESVLGHSMFNSDGEAWRAHRAMARPFFSKERVTDLEIIGKHADLAIDILCKASEPLDIQDLVSRFTMDAAFGFMFGRESHTLKGELPRAGHAELGFRGTKTNDEYGVFIQAVDEVQVLLHKRFTSHPLWLVEELFADQMKSPMVVVHKYVEACVDEVFDECAALREKGVAIDPEQATMAQYLAEHMSDRKAVRDQLVLMILAGRDTTAGLLTFTIYLLAMNPRVLSKLREDVIAHCGTDHPPTLDTLKQMKYLRAVIDESIRVFPPAPEGQRLSSQDTVLPPNSPGKPAYFVPAGTDLAWFHLLTQRRTDLWGDDAEEFVPERWFDPKTQAALSERPGIYMPFLAGVRTCIGQQFALSEASYFLARFVQRVTALELTPEAGPKGSIPPAGWAKTSGRQAYERCHPMVAIVMYAKGGMWLRCQTAD